MICLETHARAHTQTDTHVHVISLSCVVMFVTRMFAAVGNNIKESELFLSWVIMSQSQVVTRVVCCRKPICCDLKLAEMAPVCFCSSCSAVFCLITQKLWLSITTSLCSKVLHCCQWGLPVALQLMNSSKIELQRRWKLCGCVYTTRECVSEPKGCWGHSGYACCLGQCTEPKDEAGSSHRNLSLLTVNAEPLFLSGILTADCHCLKFSLTV